MNKPIFTAAIAMFSVPAYAETVPQPLVPLLACRETTGAAARLQCFDEAASKLQASVSANQVVVLERAAVTRTRRSLFGLTLPDLGLFGNGDGDSEEPFKLDTAIVTARATGGGRWTMTLAEGGTWQTTDATWSLFVRAGQSISIGRGGVGGYRATIGQAERIRVRRLM